MPPTFARIDVLPLSRVRIVVLITRLPGLVLRLTG
jgi:hypothetical protein